MTINHVHLAATNIAATRAFYERYFGFRLEFEHGEGLFLRDAAGFLIALDPTAQAPVFPAWFHLGFCLDSADAVRSVHGRMAEGDASIVRELLDEPGEYASFFVSDPDGLHIEVSWHAE